MKRIALVLAVFVLLPAASGAQAQPGSPKPDASSDSLWNRVMNLRYGQAIIVKSTYGPPLRCRFARATDALLYCYSVDGPFDAARDYCFDRASVLDVAIAHFRIPHFGVLATAVIAGTVLGLSSTRTMNDHDSATVGMISALVVGAMGYGMSAYPIHGYAFGFAYHPRGFRIGARPILRKFVPHRPIR